MQGLECKATGSWLKSKMYFILHHPLIRCCAQMRTVFDFVTGEKPFKYIYSLILK